MRHELTRKRLHALMEELARSAPKRGNYGIYFTDGGTAVDLSWRASTIDVDLYADREEAVRDVQRIKNRLKLNIEFARPQNCVPPLKHSDTRHVFIQKKGRMTFYHYDPYSQVFSKIVRGFARDIEDAQAFVREGLVDPATVVALVESIPDAAYAGYPQLDRASVEEAVKDFIAHERR